MEAGGSADMTRCSAILREGLGPDPRPFSYPYGNCNEDIARRCAFSGFVNGFTTQQGWITAASDAHVAVRSRLEQLREQYSADDPLRLPQ